MIMSYNYNNTTYTVQEGSEKQSAIRVKEHVVLN